jgi:hypothetical protein
MNNLSHKVAATFVCTALGFLLGTNTEAKAVTLTLSPNNTFGVQDFNSNSKMLWDGMGDLYASSGPVVRGTLGEIEFRIEFTLSPELLPSNTVISRAVLQTGIYLGINDWELDDFYSNPQRLGLFPAYTNPGRLGIFGSTGNGRPDLWAFGAGEFLSSLDISSSSSGDILNFDVTDFVKGQIGNRPTISAFGIRALDFGNTSLSPASSGTEIKLIIETADVPEQPVPEPTTILSAAIALGWGGWLKRKNSIKQDKTQSRD